MTDYNRNHVQEYSQTPLSYTNATADTNAYQPYNIYQQQPYIDAQVIEARATAQRVSITRAYAEMTIGLIISAVMAYFTILNNWYYDYLKATQIWGLIGIALVQAGLTIFLAARIEKMSVLTARLAFYLMATVTGFSLSIVYAIYPVGSIILALGLTAAFFAVLTMIGLTTKINLLKFGNIFLVALIVLIVAEFIMAFMHFSTGTMIVSAAALIIFAGLIAYDAQATRALFDMHADNPDMIKRLSVFCALNLYLDFINFFLHLLSLFGDRD